LKPGMTANVSITLAKKDDVLTVPNAAFRFFLQKSLNEKSKGESVGGPQRQDEGTGQEIPSGKRGRKGNGKTVWKVSEPGEPVPVRIVPGVTDGNVTEIVEGDIQEKEKVIVGIEGQKGGRKPDALPPGFGPSRQRTSPRERGI